MYRSQMEEDRLKNLQKSKSKFLSQIAANQMNNDAHLTLEEKMERLIKQAELLASFLLNKYKELGKEGEGEEGRKGSALKRSRQKKKGRKKRKSVRDKGKVWFPGNLNF
jgi:hypothetical protein